MLDHWLRKRQSLKHARDHLQSFKSIYSRYKEENHLDSLKRGETWLTSFPNMQGPSPFRYSKSNDPFSLTMKPFVFFSNTAYFCMSISAYRLGDIEKSIHYRKCMRETIQYSSLSHFKEAIPWRLLNLSIKNDCKKYNFPEYLSGLRDISPEDIASTVNYGPFYTQVPKALIHDASESLTLKFPNKEYRLSFSLAAESDLVEVFEAIGDKIISLPADHDWVGRFPLEREDLSLLE